MSSNQPTLDQLKKEVQSAIDKRKDSSTAASSSSKASNAKFDVIVVGLGSMGIAACYHLAKRGLRVLGLERFDLPHEQGSHAGQSRILRKAYGEGSSYVPLLKRAYENWHALEAETEQQVYHQTGLTYFAQPNNPFLESVKQSATQYSIPLERLSAQFRKQRYPQFEVPDSFEAMEESEAGFLCPERCILLMAQQAVKYGAVLKTREALINWTKQDDGVSVQTEKTTYQGNKMMLATGAWAGKLIPGLSSSLKVTRQVIAWFKPKKPEAFRLGQFPCWLLEDSGKMFYGFPVLDQAQFGGVQGLKVGLHSPLGDATDPDAVDRTQRTEDLEQLVGFLDRFLPDGHQQLLEMKTCLYTNSPDEDFILDFLPGSETRILLAAGFSGHGFKFASVIGEVAADLLSMGSSSLPIAFLGLDRLKTSI